MRHLLKHTQSPSGVRSNLHSNCRRGRASVRVPAALLGLVQRGMIMSWSCLPASVGNDPKTQGQDRWQVPAIKSPSWISPLLSHKWEQRLVSRVCRRLVVAWFHCAQKYASNSQANREKNEEKAFIAVEHGRNSPWRTGIVRDFTEKRENPLESLSRIWVIWEEEQRLRR